MKRNFLLLLIINCGLLAQAAVNDIFSYNGIQYQVTREEPSAQAFEVSAVQYDTAVVILPDSVTYNGMSYVVTNAILWYNKTNCPLRHYNRIDMSNAAHITSLVNQTSGLIAIDTLILPPNLLSFPANFYTSDSINARTNLYDSDHLLPGIHRVYSTGTQALENIRFQGCTSLIEADLSSYTTTYSRGNLAGGDRIKSFCCNPFLQRLILPRTITTFYDGMFCWNYQLSELSIPDSLTYIEPRMADEISMDTLRLGKKVKEINPLFADGWYRLRHIEVDSANPYFMDDHGVLYNKKQSVLWRYPFSRAGSIYKMFSLTDTIGMAAVSHFQEGIIGGIENYRYFLDSIGNAVALDTFVCSYSLSQIGEMAFCGAAIRHISNLEETHVDNIPYCCFSLSAIESVSLPPSLTEIGFQAFAYTPYLEILDLSRLKYLRILGEEAFRDGWKLQKVEMMHCHELETIPRALCLNDSALEFVSLPRNVQTIGDEAFKNCVSLQQFVCPAIEPIEIDKSVFEGVDKQACVLKVPARSINLYRNAPVWKEFFHIDTTGFYYIEATSSDTLAGTVTGSGTYFTGESAILEAKANSGYRFATWSDGYPYNPRLVEVTKDESYTAIFEEAPFYTLTVLSNDSTMGTVTGSGYYEEGAKVAVTAVPNDGYYLHSWDFTDEVSTDIIFTMPSSDITLTAYFAPKEESVETIENTAMPHKFLKEGTFYILRNNKTYSLQGQEVK